MLQYLYTYNENFISGCACMEPGVAIPISSAANIITVTAEYVARAF
jgi:hypothetical protein